MRVMMEKAWEMPFIFLYFVLNNNYCRY
jgi:hypothetical protein